MGDDAPAARSDTTGVTCVRVSTSAGRIEVRAEHRADVVVSGDASVRRDGAQLTVEGAGGPLAVVVPVGVDLLLGTGSGRIEVRGRVGRVAAVTTSGRIRVEEAGSLDARTGSSRVEAGRIAGECRVATVSGRVTVRAAGTAHVSTGSGRIDIGESRGAVSAHCVSGRIVVRLTEPADVSAETVSGRVDVRLPAGTTASHRVVARSDSGRVEMTEG